MGTEEEKKAEEEKIEAHNKLCEAIKETLGDKVEKVVVSNKLQNSPCILVTGEHGWSANMERIMKAQALRDNSMSTYMVSKKTLEINPDHAIIKGLREKQAKDELDKTTEDLIWLLFDTALLCSGFTLDAPPRFASRIHRMIQLGLDLGDAGEDDDEDDLPELEGDDEEDDGESNMEEVD